MQCSVCNRNLDQDPTIAICDCGTVCCYNGVNDSDILWTCFILHTCKKPNEHAAVRLYHAITFLPKRKLPYSPPRLRQLTPEETPKPEDFVRCLNCGRLRYEHIYTSEPAKLSCYADKPEQVYEPTTH